MSAPPPTVVLFQIGSLRLADNPMLAWAAQNGPVLPLFVWAPSEDGAWQPGAASRWWLHHSLVSLSSEHERAGSRLIVRAGESSAQTVRDVVAESGARSVVLPAPINRAEQRRNASVEQAVSQLGATCLAFNTRLLVEPQDVAPDRPSPLRVYSAFWRAAQPLINASAAPLEPPVRLAPPARWPASLRIEDLQLLPTRNWTSGLAATWQPGEPNAQRALNAFLNADLSRYVKERDHLAVDGTSRLSPYLHFGELSAQRLWHALSQIEPSPSVTKLQSELGWREFAHYLLWHTPDLADRSLDQRFDRIPWRESNADLRRWQRGRTGFPLVDAGMRQLWQTGWMHNRVRMLVASFLVKDLLQPWQAGARWFWDTLVDADLANNTIGWQWAAGAAADAAPFTRIFNPTLQAQRFDAAGAYIRKYVPELEKLSIPHLFEPWSAPEDILRSAGVRLGETYPEPMIDHAFARKRALAAFAARKPPPAPTEVKGPFMAARFVNDAIRANAMSPRDPVLGLPSRFEFREWADGIPLDRLQGVLLEHILTQDAPRACALVDSYLERTVERQQLLETITNAACHFQNDPHVMRNCTSSVEEFTYNQTPRKDDILRGFVKHQARYVKRATDYAAYNLWARFFDDTAVPR